MSYILEALKKAQAERQLGSTPTIHALPIHTAAELGREQRRLLWLGLVAGGVLIAAGSWWWAGRAPAPAAVQLVAAPVAAPAVAPFVPAPPQPPVVAPPKPVAAKPAAPKPAPKPLAPAPIPSLRELPEALQSSLPKVSFGGYMYSANPADRLLLVDKVLRHEGEEVAPGLVLEQLLPKEAVMNYRGSRYRLAY